MGVPRNFLNSTENSTKLSYDSAYIQKIPTKRDTTPRPSVAPTFRSTSYYSNRTNERTNSYSDRDRELIHKRFQELFNTSDTYLLDFPWLSSTNVTYNDSSLFEIPFPTKIHVVIRQTPTWKYYLSAPTILFFVVTVLRIFVCYQRLSSTENCSRRRLSEEQRRPSVLDTDPQQMNETGPPPVPPSTSAIIIDPEFPTQNNSHSDLPPSYSQCAVNNIETGNKIVNNNTSEDLPPPYFICIGTMNATDDIPKTHKRQGVEEQSCTETDIHLNNLHTTNRNTVEQLDSTVRPLNRTVEAAIDIDEFNNNNDTDEENSAKILPRPSR